MGSINSKRLLSAEDLKQQYLNGNLVSPKDLSSAEYLKQNYPELIVSGGRHTEILEMITKFSPDSVYNKESLTPQQFYDTKIKGHGKKWIVRLSGYINKTLYYHYTFNSLDDLERNVLFGEIDGDYARTTYCNSDCTDECVYCTNKHINTFILMSDTDNNQTPNTLTLGNLFEKWGSENYRKSDLRFKGDKSLLATACKNYHIYGIGHIVTFATKDFYNIFVQDSDVFVQCPTVKPIIFSDGMKLFRELLKHGIRRDEIDD